MLGADGPVGRARKETMTVEFTKGLISVYERAHALEPPSWETDIRNDRLTTYARIPNTFAWEMRNKIPDLVLMSIYFIFALGFLVLTFWPDDWFNCAAGEREPQRLRGPGCLDPQSHFPAPGIRRRH